MKSALLIVLLVSVAMAAFSVEPSVYKEAGLVTYFSQDFYVGSWDLIDLHVAGDDYLFSFDFYGRYYLEFQNADWYLFAQDILDVGVGFSKQTGYVPFNAFLTERVVASDQIYVDVTKYFMDLVPVPIQLSGRGSLRLEDLYEPEIYADWTAHLGIGRILDVTPVARAIGVAEKLNADLANEQIIDASRIIAKSDEYRYLHRGNYDEEYYGAVAAALSLSDQVMAVRRALLDTGTISKRRIGWSFVISYYQNYLYDLMQLEYEDIPDPHLRLNGDLAIPIGLAAQLSPSIWLGTLLSEAPYFYGGFDVNVTIDHSTDWSSSAGLYFGGNYDPGSDLVVMYTLYAGTRIQLIDRLYSDVTMNVGQDYNDQLLLNVDLSFRYYIL